MLARKWPEKYNSAGHLSWCGRVYGNALQGTLLLRDKIYHGTWGSAPFQSLYHCSPGLLRSLFVAPEWYLVNLALGTLAFVGFRWKPLLIAFPLLALSAGVPQIEVLSRAARVRFKRVPRARCARIAMRALTAFLHMAQPLARLHGRLSCGLTLWRRGARGFVFPCLRRITLWSEHWQPHDHRLRSVERALQRMCAVVCRGGDYDRWDLEIWGGLLGMARLSMAVEEHGAGRQLAQFRVWPRCSALGAGLIFLFAFLAGWSALQREWMAFIILGTAAKLTAILLLRDCGSATAAALRALRDQEETT